MYMKLGKVYYGRHYVFRKFFMLATVGYHKKMRNAEIFLLEIRQNQGDALQEDIFTRKVSCALNNQLRSRRKLNKYALDFVGRLV